MYANVSEDDRSSEYGFWLDDTNIRPTKENLSDWFWYSENETHIAGVALLLIEESGLKEFHLENYKTFQLCQL